MANRYANLTPSAKISQEYTKITEGFDKVQSEMDQRIAKDNDLQSQITNEQQQRIAADQAHQNSTAAHPAEHITYSGKVSGASNIKQAADKLNDRIDNIVAQGGSDNTEVVDARMGADGVARPTLGTLVREIHAQQLDEARQTVTLKHGQNIVTTDQASPVDLVVKGRTLVNLLGSVGNCSDLSKFSQVANYGPLPFEVDTSDSYVGGTSFKSVGAAYSQTLVLPLNLKAGKYYLVGCYIKNGHTSYISLSPDSGGALNSDNREVVIASSNWRYWHLKVNPEQDGWYFKALKGYEDNDSAFMNIDAISVYEVTSEEYAKIGVDPEWSGDKLAEKFPYVDGLKSVVNPVITKYGKNLLSPYPGTISPLAKITGPYELEMNTTSGQNYNAFQVPVIGNTKYTLSCDVVKLSGSGNAYGYLTYLGAQGNAIGTSSYVTPTQKKITVTTPANAVRADFTQQCDGSVSAVFKNWQLELGEVATPFEPQNDDYIYAECVLRSLPNGARDVLDPTTRIKIASVGTYIIQASDIVGFESSYVRINMPSGANRSSGALNVIVQDSAGNVFLPVASINLAGPGNVVNRGDGGFNLYHFGDVSDLNQAKTKFAGATLYYQLSTPITETIPIEGAIALHDGQNIIEVGEGVIIREKTTPQYSSLEGGYYFFNVKSSYWGVDHKFKYPAENVLKVYRDDEEFTRWSKYSTPSSTYGRFGVVIKASDFVPGEYSVTYIASKYMMTANIVDATMAYNTNQKTVVDALTRDMADAKTEISIHDRILAEYAARLLALEEG